MSDTQDSLKTLLAEDVKDSWFNLCISEGIFYTETHQIDDSNNTFYGLSVALTKRNSENSRGVDIKALAVCCKNPIFMVYKVCSIQDLLKEFAKKLFNTDIKYPQLTEEVYNTVNVLLFKSHPIFSIHEKKVNKAILHRYEDQTFPEGLPKLIHKYRFKQNISFILDINLTLLPHEYLPHSYIKLLELFGENLMKIYDAVLREQRVIAT
jgi:hypothetical protein